MTAKDKKPIPRFGALKTAIDCRRELARTYRQYRRGEIDDREAKTSGYLLQTLVGIIREGDLDARISALEEMT
jgi:hypothetical protein